MSSEPIIRLERVTKRFRSKVAVDDVSFDVARGRCLGWLGPNGSGKTTLIRCMLGLARVSSGSISVRGHAMPGASDAALERVGGIVEEPRFYPYLTGRGNLEVWAGFLGGEARLRVLPALDRVGLAADGDRKVKQYSMGMRQRLGVARSLLNDPELLILDEPSNGLDPSGMAAFRSMIRSFVEEDGRTVFVSSHLLDEVEKIADDIAIVHEGKLVLHGTVAELVGAGRQGLRLRVDDADRAVVALGSLRLVTGVELRGAQELRVELESFDDASVIALNRSLVQAGIGVAEVVRERASLEERFLEITGSTVDGAL